MNDEQRLIALVGRKARDVACHHCFARTCWKHIDRRTVTGDSNAEFIDGAGLIFPMHRRCFGCGCHLSIMNDAQKGLLIIY